MGIQLQRLLKAAGQEIGEVKPIFELNPEHQLVLKLKTETNETDFSDWSHLLFEQAVLAEGAQLKDPAMFIQRVNRLLLK
jgi:molecular chaperone HtpG